MNKYWAIATSEHFGGDTRVKELEAQTDADAVQEGNAWKKKDLGFDWKVVVTKQISE
ncbi:MAG: hypothetical protein Q8P49_02565 [Candidatus Liptonbacteria bacterium]|nr:hypothetical protein [Candidatus Liptonbacteria bacterium]